ncbi:MAG: serine hydrolase, partial [Hyphomonadaceae bacterium]|nr:serine hydrolase [Hyphomonadaceae bacterium]
GRVNEQDYALGFRSNTVTLDGFGTVRVVNHGGVSKGAQCWLAILPEQGLVIALSTNRRTEEFFDFAGVWPALAHPFLLAQSGLRTP